MTVTYFKQLVAMFTIASTIAAGGWAVANTIYVTHREHAEEAKTIDERIDTLERKIDRLIILMEAKNR